MSEQIEKGTETMSSSLLTFAGESSESALVMPAIGYGLVALAVLALLLLVTMGFRSVGSRRD
ncbi:MAG TPA: hypothetical protein VK095_03550 [Beutenbergiaceae bacterium]|nr:hypothetical protein [Beutenbergiaceae bacterium]